MRKLSEMDGVQARGTGLTGRREDEQKDAESPFLRPRGIAVAEAGCVRPAPWKFIAAFSTGCSMEGLLNPDVAFVKTSLFENMLTERCARRLRDAFCTIDAKGLRSAGKGIGMPSV
mgnify:CR=1 FL=1